MSNHRRMGTHSINCQIDRSKLIECAVASFERGMRHSAEVEELGKHLYERMKKDPDLLPKPVYTAICTHPFNRTQMGKPLHAYLIRNMARDMGIGHINAIPKRWKLEEYENIVKVLITFSKSLLLDFHYGAIFKEARNDHRTTYPFARGDVSLVLSRTSMDFCEILMCEVKSDKVMISRKRTAPQIVTEKRKKKVAKTTN